VTGWHEIALFAVFGFIVTWVGTYCINLIRVPPILHRELGEENQRLRHVAFPAVPPEELQKREMVKGLVGACDFAKETKIALRRALEFDGEIKPMTLGVSAFGSRVAVEILEKGVGSGLISKGADGVFKIRANFQSALRFILDNELGIGEEP